MFTEVFNLGGDYYNEVLKGLFLFLRYFGFVSAIVFFSFKCLPLSVKSAILISLMVFGFPVVQSTGSSVQSSVEGLHMVLAALLHPELVFKTFSTHVSWYAVLLQLTIGAFAGIIIGTVGYMILLLGNWLSSISALGRYRSVVNNFNLDGSGTGTIVPFKFLLTVFLLSAFVRSGLLFKTILVGSTLLLSVPLEVDSLRFSLIKLLPAMLSMLSLTFSLTIFLAVPFFLVFFSANFGLLVFERYFPGSRIGKLAPPLTQILIVMILLSGAYYFEDQFVVILKSTLASLEDAKIINGVLQ